jgi:hypothetical protein
VWFSLTTALKTIQLSSVLSIPAASISSQGTVSTDLQVEIEVCLCYNFPEKLTMMMYT